MLGDLAKKTVEPLTDGTERIESFEIGDRKHFVYAAPDPDEVKKKQAASQGMAVVGTGQPMYELLFPQDERWFEFSARKLLWAVAYGKRSEVKRNGEPVDAGGAYALSPDGSTLVMKLAMGEVPASWEKLYPPPSDTWTDDRIHAGSKDVKQYALLHLETGAVESLTDAPEAEAGGWWWGGYEAPDWSSDGKAVLLPGTFLKSKDGVPSQPCVAIVELPSKKGTCVEMLQVKPPNGHQGFLLNAEFAAADKSKVVVRYWDGADESYKKREYERNGSGWREVGQSDLGRTAYGNVEVSIKQGLNEPPVLAAREKEASRVLWDPNPQLKNMAMGDVSVYTWKDSGGHEAKGGLYKPVGYKPGQRYPLVIQTHGFSQTVFTPSGVFPSAFAARAFAGAGIMVLQSEDSGGGCGKAVTPQEGLCAVAAFEGAVKQLVADGLVDPEKIGIIGFSRSCYYVMEMLTASSLHLKAALVADGITEDYMEYMLDDRVAGEGDKMMGAAPFGEGLQQWLKQSPGFNLDKIRTPLRIEPHSTSTALLMWQPYSGLRRLHKPVELIMLNTTEHVLTNPEARMASQGGSVDWFRFWLQGYEDPNPAKAEQYKRWRELRKMQEENDKKK